MTARLDVNKDKCRGSCKSRDSSLCPAYTIYIEHFDWIVLFIKKVRRNYLTNDNKAYITEICNISAFRNYTPRVHTICGSRDIPRKTFASPRKMAKSGKIVRFAIDKMINIAHFYSKVRDCYKCDNIELYKYVIPRKFTFQIRAPEFNR